MRAMNITVRSLRSRVRVEFWVAPTTLAECKLSLTQKCDFNYSKQKCSTYCPKT